MADELKVDIKVFSDTADKIKNVSKEMEACFRDLSKEIQHLRSIWQGDASDDMKGIVASVGKSGNDLYSNIAKYSNTLYEVAGLYDKIEKTNAETAKSLKFDSSSMK